MKPIATISFRYPHKSLEGSATLGTALKNAVHSIGTMKYLYINSIADQVIICLIYFLEKG